MKKKDTIKDVFKIFVTCPNQKIMSVILFMCHWCVRKCLNLPNYEYV